MRGLQTHDVFVAMRVVKALGVKDEFKRMADAIAQGKMEMNERQIGLDVILAIIGNAGDEKAEQSVYEALAGPLEMDPHDLAVMDPMTLIENVKALSEFIDTEAWKSFFTSAANLMK